MSSFLTKILREIKLLKNKLVKINLIEYHIKHIFSDYIMRLEKSKHPIQKIDALEVYTKVNIKDYLARPEEKFDQEYSKKDKKLGNIFAKMI